MKPLFLVAIVSASLAGCVPYPIYKALQPAAKATILDPTGKPVPGAEVTLIANASPYGRESSRVTQQTGGDGVARFPSVHQMRIESLMIHGSTEFVWSWCVRKPGYQTYDTARGNGGRFVRDLVVRLQPGRSKPCPPFQ